LFLDTGFRVIAESQRTIRAAGDASA